jgi:hypothetical protein
MGMNPTFNKFLKSDLGVFPTTDIFQHNRANRIPQTLPSEFRKSRASVNLPQ